MVMTYDEKLERNRRYCRESYARNKEKRRRDGRARYHAHKDIRKSYMKSYHQINKAHLNEKSKKYYYANLEEMKASCQSRQILYRQIRPWARLLIAARNRAVKKKIEFNLDNDWAINRWNGSCELSGLPFDLVSRGQGPRAFSPSIDRIDPQIGYTKDNCRFILFSINAMKQKGTDKDVYHIAKALVGKLSDVVMI